MKNMNKAMMAAATAVILCAMGGCGDKDKQSYSYSKPREGETIETLAVLTDMRTETEPTTAPTTTPTPIHELSRSIEQTHTLETTTETTTEAITDATEATTEAPEDFTLSDEEVANKMHDYFSAKGYNDAQIAGIVGNAEVESGLEPSRGVSGGGFGLFQLMDCPQRREMLAELNNQGVGKYASSDYWALNASNFDTAEDFDTFMEVMLDYTMNPDDPTWMSELFAADSPEEAAEVFLVHYERAVNGGSPIEYYSAYSGRYYQATDSRREAARRWYDYFTA